MGTSASNTGPNNKSPLLPPWAEQGDSVEIESGGGQDGDDVQQAPDKVEVDNGKVQEKISGPIPNILLPNRLNGARKSFGDYAKSDGTSSNLRSSLKKYSQSSGGGSGTSRRLASGITAGSGLLGIMQGNVSVHSTPLFHPIFSHSKLDSVFIS